MPLSPAYTASSDWTAPPGCAADTYSLTVHLTAVIIPLKFGGYMGAL